MVRVRYFLTGAWHNRKTVQHAAGSLGNLLYRRYALKNATGINGTSKSSTNRSTGLRDGARRDTGSKYFVLTIPLPVANKYSPPVAQIAINKERGHLRAVVTLRL